MSKSLHSDEIAHELEGSAFFHQRERSPSVETVVAGVDVPVRGPQATVSTTGRPVDRAIGRTRQRRTLKRCAFEIYQDQLEQLQRRALHDKLRGEKGSMSEMVRAAVDAYLAFSTQPAD